MSQKKLLSIINILLVLTAVGMIVVGIKMELLAPAITGFGFLLIAWAHRIMK